MTSRVKHISQQLFSPLFELHLIRLPSLIQTVRSYCCLPCITDHEIGSELGSIKNKRLAEEEGAPADGVGIFSGCFPRQLKRILEKDLLQE